MGVEKSSGPVFLLQSDVDDFSVLGHFWDVLKAFGGVIFLKKVNLA